MASLIANEFSEATNDLHVSALMAVGAVLFVVTIIVNMIARWLVWRTGTERRLTMTATDHLPRHAATRRRPLVSRHARGEHGAHARPAPRHELRHGRR